MRGGVYERPKTKISRISYELLNRLVDLSVLDYLLDYSTERIFPRWSFNLIFRIYFIDYVVYTKIQAFFRIVVKVI